MSLAGKIAWDDTVLPFQLDRADVRGRVARVDSVLEAILGQHSYPAPVAALVAEATLLAALIGQTIKLRWKLQLQIRGDGPIRMIAADYFAPVSDREPARMRAYAAYDAPALDSAAEGARHFDLLGQGLFGVLIDQGRDMAPYQGITPIAGDTLSNCAETYFAQSEQLPTHFALAVALAQEPGREAAWRGGGVMLQHLANASPHAKGGASGPEGLLAADDILEGDDAENWIRALTLLDTVEESELIGPRVGPETLLLRLFHEEVPRVFDPQPVEFGCTCGPEKVVGSLAAYSREDIAEMTAETGKVTADCQFCGAHYEFDPKLLGRDAPGMAG